MKVKHFRLPRLVMATAAQGRGVLLGFWKLYRRRQLLTFGVAIFVAGVGFLVLGHDESLLSTLHFWHGAREDAARRVAWYLGMWGDYPTYNVPLALGIWLYGLWAKSSAWRRVAVVCFLGATLAGLFDDCFRLTMGRPRPDAHMEDGFYGISHAFRGGFQSFPSGHAACVFGTATALLVTDLRLGIITTIFAFAVVWARMELDRHYPSDVVVGALIGTYFGLMIGVGARRRHFHAPGTR